MNLQPTIDHWRALAASAQAEGAAALAVVYERSACAAELHRDTGRPHCPCHLVPVEECGAGNQPDPPALKAAPPLPAANDDFWDRPRGHYPRRWDEIAQEEEDSRYQPAGRLPLP